VAIDDRRAILAILKRNIEDLAIPRGGRSQVILFEGERIRVGYSIRYLHPGLKFPVIGSVSSVIVGSQRRTEDVYFAVSTAALYSVEDAALNDPRFSKRMASRP